MARGTPLTTEQIEQLNKSYAKSRNVAHCARKHGVSYAAAWKAIHGAKDDRRRYLQERAVERGLRAGRRALVANGQAIAALLAQELLAGSVEPSHVAALQSAHSSTQRELVRQSLLELKRKQAALTRAESRARIELVRAQTEKLRRVDDPSGGDVTVVIACEAPPSAGSADDAEPLRAASG